MSDNGETRECETCGETKGIGEFPFLGASRKKRRGICRVCWGRHQDRAYARRNIERVRKKNREYMRRRREHARLQMDAELQDARDRLGYKRGSLNYEKDGSTRNDLAELKALRIVEILQVAPELVTDEMWEKLCELEGGEVLL